MNDGNAKRADQTDSTAAVPAADPHASGHAREAAGARHCAERAAGEQGGIDPVWQRPNPCGAYNHFDLAKTQAGCPTCNALRQWQADGVSECCRECGKPWYIDFDGIRTHSCAARPRNYSTDTQEALRSA